MPYQLVRARARDAFDQQHVHRVLEHRTVPLLLDVLEVLGRRATRGVVLAHVTDAARELREALAGGRVAAPFDAQVLGLEELGAGDQEDARGAEDFHQVSGVGGWMSGSRARSSLGTPQARSEEHTSELQSRLHLVCRLLLEKKKRATI